MWSAGKRGLAVAYAKVYGTTNIVTTHTRDTIEDLLLASQRNGNHRSNLAWFVCVSVSVSLSICLSVITFSATMCNKPEKAILMDSVLRWQFGDIHKNTALKSYGV